MPRVWCPADFHWSRNNRYSRIFTDALVQSTVMTFKRCRIFSETNKRRLARPWNNSLGAPSFAQLSIGGLARALKIVGNDISRKMVRREVLRAHRPLESRKWALLYSIYAFERGSLLLIYVEQKLFIDSSHSPAFLSGKACTDVTVRIEVGQRRTSIAQTSNTFVCGSAECITTQRNMAS
jgi:hypothetical protein